MRKKKHFADALGIGSASRERTVEYEDIFVPLGLQINSNVKEEV